MSAVSADGPGLAALVASRLCHDLISPVGAIGNGLELLQAMLPASPELDLVGESAATALARIRFFRIAFGAAAEPETVEARTLAETLRGQYGTGRIALDWTPAPLPRRETRLLFLLLLCAESALPLGGRLTADPGPGALRLFAEGRRTRFEPAPWDHLLNGAPFPDCPSAQVQFRLARLHAEAEGWRPVLSQAEGGFALLLERGAGR